MNKYAVAAVGVPTVTVLAHTLTGALAKAEAVNAKLFPGKSFAFTGKLVKRNVR